MRGKATPSRLPGLRSLAQWPGSREIYLARLSEPGPGCGITFHPMLKSLEIPLVHPDTEIKEATRGLDEAKSLLAITESLLLSSLHLSDKNRPIKIRITGMWIFLSHTLHIFHQRAHTHTQINRLKWHPNIFFPFPLHQSLSHSAGGFSASCSCVSLNRRRRSSVTTGGTEDSSTKTTFQICLPKIFAHLVLSLFDQWSQQWVIHWALIHNSLK